MTGSAAVTNSPRPGIPPRRPRRPRRRHVPARPRPPPPGRHVTPWRRPRLHRRSGQSPALQMCGGGWFRGVVAGSRWRDAATVFPQRAAGTRRRVSTGARTSEQAGPRRHGARQVGRTWRQVLDCRVTIRTIPCQGTETRQRRWSPAWAAKYWGGPRGGPGWDVESTGAPAGGVVGGQGREQGFGRAWQLPPRWRVVREAAQGRLAGRLPADGPASHPYTWYVPPLPSGLDVLCASASMLFLGQPLLPAQAL